VRRVLGSALTAARERIRAFEDRLIGTRLAPYGVAVSRVLAVLAYVGILVTNFGHRQILFGAGSDWARSYRSSFPQASWLGLVENLSPAAFTLFYLAVIVVGLAFALGWHARLTGPLLLLGAVQIIEMNPVVHDQGDNILRIGLFLILLTDNAGVWSLDAARARAGRRSRIVLPARVQELLAGGPAKTAKILLHNGAVIALAAQLVTIYIAAGLYKAGGNGWRFGSAISYPLRLDEYRVWPVLNDLAVSSAVGVWFMTYFAVLLQLYFPVLLLNRVTRRIALVAVLLLHLGIAVLMGLPWFTLAMVAFDGIFVSTTTYLAIEHWVAPRAAELVDRIRSRLPAARATVWTESE
jgi:hypothetical protein